MNKVCADAAQALADVHDHATSIARGFGLSGTPENCILELALKGTKGLTIIANNCGTTDKGLGVLLAQGQVKKMIASYVQIAAGSTTFEEVVQILPPLTD